MTPKPIRVTIEATAGLAPLHDQVYAMARFLHPDYPEEYRIWLWRSVVDGWTVDDDSDADPTHHPDYPSAIDAFFRSIASQIRLDSEGEDA